MSVSPFPRTASMNVCKAFIPQEPCETFIKVPVLLQKFTVQIPMHALITFPDGEKVLEIKKIKKRVFITQCRLVSRAPTPEEIANPSTYSAKLFISGFVRKNIQYAANPEVDCKKEILSSINSLTVEVPFDCVVEIEEFRKAPVGPFLDTRDEYGFFTSHPLGKGFPEKDRLLSNDLSQFHQQSTEFFNELPFCEIVRSDITEFDEAIERKCEKEILPFEKECRVIKCVICQKKPCRWCQNNRFKGESKQSLFQSSYFPVNKSFNSKECPRCSHGRPKKCDTCTNCLCQKCNPKPIMKEKTFTELSEKMVLDLSLKLLQKQDVPYPC